MGMFTLGSCRYRNRKWLVFGVDLPFKTSYRYGMAKPLRKGPPISFRLSVAASEELARRASNAGVTPVEHLVAQLEKSLQTKTVSGDEHTMARIPDKVDWAIGPTKGTVPCRHWRKISRGGKMVCTLCGQIL